MLSSINTCIDVSIPQNAVQIKVTNIINPYYIRIYEIQDDRNVKQNLCKRLQTILKSQLKSRSHKNYISNVGDDVIVSTNRVDNEKVDLPYWICRGVVTDTTINTADVFLLDYGIAVNVPTESLVQYVRDSVPFETLTVTVGIYNILPVDSKLGILKEWPKSTVNFIKDLIQTSKKTYFEVLACDRKINKVYGDLFLVIEDKNICLSNVLINTLLAVPLYDELSQAIRNSNTAEKTLVPYQLLQSKNGTDNNINNKHLTIMKRKTAHLKKKDTIEKILIRSNFNCQPLEHIEDARFTSCIHKALKNQGIRSPKQIQSYMWPAIKQGLNVVAISNASSGKTLGYIVPTVNCIAANEELILENQKDDIVTKPLALILCATVTKCVDVASICKNVLQYHSSIKTFAAFNGLTDKQIMTNICNKFHILVSTPPFLLRLLEKFSNKLSFSKLSFVVIDHTDDLLEKYLRELMVLIKKYKITDESNKNTIQGGSVQIVTVSQCWTDRMRLFVDKCVKDPYICIGSFTEAAAFCRVQGRMLIRHADKKKHDVLELLVDYLKVKTMIFCINSQEAIELQYFLELNSIKTLLAHEEMVVTQISEIKEEWTKYLSGMYPVFICTDQVLSELEISDIEFLIHYTITNTSKTQFNRRFSVLMDNWLLDLKNKCRVLILFDETKESTHFKGVINILKRLKVELPSDWAEIADGLDLNHNLKKKNYPLCDLIKTFGVCKKSSCSYRHRVIAEVDQPTTCISVGDELKLHIIYIHGATHFSVRVLECIKTCPETKSKKTITFPYEILKLDKEMRQYYSESKNRRILRDVKVGGVCASKNTDNTFSRVQILNIIENDITTNKPKIVRVRNIDSGLIFDRLYVHELCELPEELLKYKFAILDVFLTGITPFDAEYQWTDIAYQDSVNWFEKYSGGRSSYIHAKVLLHIGSSIWAHSVVSHSKLIGYPDLVCSSLTDVLIKNQHGISDLKYLNNLIQLCHKGGITEINGYPLEISADEDNNNNKALDQCD